MAIETIAVDAGKLNKSKDWVRLSSLNYVQAKEQLFSYYIEVSREGTSTRAIVVGKPISKVYYQEDKEVRDFIPVSTYASKDPELISEIRKELKLQGKDAIFL